MKFLKISVLIFYLSLIGLLGLASPVFAQGSLTLTITPPLIKINMDPGGSWSSSIKVVNNNAETLTVYAQTVDFKSGDQGGVKFIPKEEIKEGQKFLLSQWIEITSDPLKIPSFESKEVPFTIKVPQEAEPGGHYAAILIGTKPPEATEGVAIKIASQISSLILLSIQGEIDERGWIREFSTEKGFYQEPEADFKVSFENLGNIHLQPVGEIRIYNMWNKERGIISMNYKSHFGNVLPQSQRVWNFKWKGKEGGFEIGKYKAELVLSFGQEARQTVSSTIYFWVIPLVPVMGVLGGFFIFFLLLIFGIRTYVKRAIMIAQREAGIVKKKESQIKLTSKVLRGPIHEAIVDLRRATGQEKGSKHKNILNRLGFLIKKYYKFAIFSLIISLWAMAAVFYIQDTLKLEKGFEIIQEEKKEENNFVKEEVSTSSPINEIEISKKDIVFKIFNGSGIPGIAAKTAVLLESRGFIVEELGNADSFNYQETIIKYKKGKEDYAKEINQLLDEIAQLELVDSQIEDIVIIIGKNFEGVNLF